MNSKGSILIVCLWALVVLSVLAVALGNLVYSQMKFVNSFIRNVNSLPLVKSACLDGLSARKEELDKTSGYDSEKELLKEREVEFSPGLGYKYYFEDEGARININTATSAVLEKLPGLGADIGKAIFNSSRKPFKAKEELLLIEGISKEKFKEFKDLITIYGDGMININAAPRGVLLALGLDEEVAGMVARYRKDYSGIDGERGTDDDGAFTSASTIAVDLGRFTFITARQELEFVPLMNILTVKSSILNLHIFPLIKGLPGTRYQAIINPEENKVLFWREG